MYIICLGEGDISLTVQVCGHGSSAVEYVLMRLAACHGAVVVAMVGNCKRARF